MLRTKGKPSFASVPNFRTVVTEEGETPKLYRSSRPDFIKDDELKQFKALGIRSIIDFRSVSEYNHASGTKLLDFFYPCYEVRYLRKGFGRLPDGHTHDVRPAKTKTEPRDVQGKHFLVNFFQLNYVWAKFNQAPLWFRLCSLFYLLYDVVMNTGYVNFVRAFAQKVLNPTGLLGQYKDMVTLSQEPIRSALNLLTDKNNIPAVLNCAHGKDRTGIVSALVLACLGKSRDYIAKNYAQSELELEFMKERLHHEIVEHLHMCTTFTTAREETMLSLLDYIDEKYGSVSRYLECIGFTKSQQEQLRQNLLPSTELT